MEEEGAEEEEERQSSSSIRIRRFLIADYHSVSYIYIYEYNQDHVYNISKNESKMLHYGSLGIELKCRN